MTAADLASDLRAALDVAYFAEARLGLVLDPWQARVVRSEARQVVLVCSRQSGKSTVAALLAVHEVVHNPGALVLLGSPSLRQATELLGTARSMLLRLRPAPAIAGESTLSLRLSTGARIVALPGNENTTRGYARVRLLVLDEAGFLPTELVAALRPTLAVGGGRIVLSGTPNGRAGPLWDAWSSGDPAWHRERVTASECPRIDAAFLAQEKRDLGPWRFATEYLAEFADAESQFFAGEMISRALSHDVAPLRI